ncbi:dTDP-4-dehydrorhamnose reductase [Candidatus Kinetoplastibacterium sorsogonicusi]|uniref:dTDP-4-dehydrorhamnose reductase n=1 Tax=Candidatus Kinetoplastidibacterium kentomonadis TaxID=1576550 RepID=A0A3S7J9D8_9PROT|nr:NAD(P)-dependent oxidoreductase [Candidatus Kinetoplastibacterium sorsogonicusi]AWD32287.1 dTDP-4-dehydrorhamnose reductase [Candidatus Kinetoplastibacterium sorsogonicusi]
MKILLIGSNGRLGKALKYKIKKLNVNIVQINRKDINLYYAKNLIEKLNIIKPDIIINAAAFTNVDQAELSPKYVFMLNTYLVSILAKYSYENGILIIHYSTNYVFDGNKKDLYNENDRTNPINIYGYSKYLSENNIFISKSKYLIFRFGWLISNYKNNLVTNIINSLLTDKILSINYNQIIVPTHVDIIVDITIIFIIYYINNININIGLYHISPLGRVNIYNLSCYILDYMNFLDIKTKIDKNNIIINNNNKINLRPYNACLNSSKIKKLLRINIPHWKIGVNKVINQFFKSY